MSFEPTLGPDGIDLDQFLGQIEKKLILKALEIKNGVKTEAANLLGINFRSFRYRLNKYNI